MRDRVLLLSRSIPPETSGSAIIVGNLAKQFSSREMVVAGERPFGRPTVVWLPEWPQLVHAIAGWPPGMRGARWWRALQFPLLVLHCFYLVRKYRCTAIVVVFPHEAFLLAGYLAARWTGAKLFPYFHNTYAENRRGLSGRVARWLQARVLKHAAHVLLMSEGMVRLFRDRYPEVKCSALPHCYNGVQPVFAPPPEPRSPPRFVISGTISESCQEATMRVCEAIAHVPGAPLTLLSGTPHGLLRRLGLLRPSVRHETVSHDHVVVRLRDADFVVLAHGFRGALSDEEYDTIFPTRTIEYLICGRPILAHAPRDCYLTRFLREHDCALLVTEPTVPALLDAIEQLRRDAALRARLVRNALGAAQQFRGDRVAAILRDHLRLNGVPRSPQATIREATSRRVPAQGPGR